MRQSSFAVSQTSCRSKCPAPHRCLLANQWMSYSQCMQPDRLAVIDCLGPRVLSSLPRHLRHLTRSPIALAHFATFIAPNSLPLPQRPSAPPSHPKHCTPPSVPSPSASLPSSQLPLCPIALMRRLTATPSAPASLCRFLPLPLGSFQQPLSHLSALSCSQRSVLAPLALRRS